MASSKSDVRELLGVAARAPTCCLPRGTNVVDVAEECRRGAVVFVSGIDGHASRRAIAAWLDGPYRTAVEMIGTRSLDVPLRAGEVTEIVAYARAHVIGVIRGIARVPSDVSFTHAAMHDGWIEPCTDATGRSGWVPVDRPKMRLSERVLSLVAVDYLVRPADWLAGRASKIAV
ncbi:MAG: hypothetical protein JWP87_3021 [Labilithrix sp.]|nr:hypothetical protein [Labilithrix sp.]